MRLSCVAFEGNYLVWPCVKMSAYVLKRVRHPLHVALWLGQRVHSEDQHMLIFPRDAPVKPTHDDGGRPCPRRRKPSLIVMWK